MNLRVDGDSILHGALGLLVRGRPHAHAARFDSDDAALLEHSGVTFDDAQAGRYLLPCGHIHQANDSAMRQLEEKGERSEVLVESDHNPALLNGYCQDFFVARIFVPISGVNDIVPCSFIFPPGADYECTSARPGSTRS